ncbi:MAG TPA: pyridoxal 5'-phosphate synthase glutaminase subunit PdxT [Peptococcaceae bacterium]|nr:MAG: Glutamine amidotransferase subunit PdxT [Moorella sp. 60_41]HBT48168.1 pyridoxal 5'-phosphate synthase glutaminase subunit PdxT [Peptococcaceae bacterium]
MLVGVLALQGAFREHIEKLEACGARGREVRKPRELEGVEALIIPGGESTAIGRLMVEFSLLEPIRRRGEQGMPIWGTCAGMVLLAKDIIDSQQTRLSLMDMKVRRNAFGRQVDSFETDLSIPPLGSEPFRGVFIRAPYAEEVGPGVEVLAAVDGKIVAARQGKLLATAFHPELTGDLRFHQYFLKNAQ